MGCASDGETSKNHRGQIVSASSYLATMFGKVTFYFFNIPVFPPLFSCILPSWTWICAKMWENVCYPFHASRITETSFSSLTLSSSIATRYNSSKFERCSYGLTKTFYKFPPSTAYIHLGRRKLGNIFGSPVKTLQKIFLKISYISYTRR